MRDLDGDADLLEGFEQRCGVLDRHAEPGGERRRRHQGGGGQHVDRRGRARVAPPPGDGGAGGEPERALTQDEMLDDISLYWFTNTAASAARFYWENNANNFNAVSVSIPAAVTVFPGEIYRAPRSWTERSYHQLIYFNETDRGGHFAAWEEPDLFTAEIRAAFRPLRPANSSTKERSL